MAILIDENSLLDGILVLFCQDLLRMAAKIYFCSFSTAACSFMTLFYLLSFENQARLTWKIVGSYSRVFTALTTSEGRLD